MSDLAHTPAAIQAAATAKREARENAIRANGIKEGRQKATAEILQQLGVQRLEEASQLHRLMLERDARILPSEERKHVKAARNMGVIIGIGIGALMISAIWTASMLVSFNQAGTYGREMAVTGAIAQGVNPPRTCTPGETLPDGRVCPGG